MIFSLRLRKAPAPNSAGGGSNHARCEQAAAVRVHRSRLLHRILGDLVLGLLHFRVDAPETQAVRGCADPI
jgi:hypothetical protein